MRTTVTLDDKLLNDLREATGIRSASALIQQALLEMRQRQAGRRMIALGATDPSAWAPNEGDGAAA